MRGNRGSGEAWNMPPACISVCICTYKRPDMLARTLGGVIAQDTDPDFTWELVVVDNDELRSARTLVQDLRASGKGKIIYDYEPIKNIALARNRTVRNASGDLIAFIDDDEFPAKDWLRTMYRCMLENEAEGVLGPVLPDFPAGTPEWLPKSGLCDRPRNITGSPLRAKDLRTGNALLDAKVFREDQRWFDPPLGITGGSDGVFLWRQIQKGRRFVWCDEGLVFETVPEERWPAEFYLRRKFRIGSAAGGMYRSKGNVKAVLKSVLQLFGYSVALPFTAFAGQHVWMRILTRIWFHAGCLLSFFGLTHVPNKP